MSNNFQNFSHSVKLEKASESFSLAEQFFNQKKFVSALEVLEAAKEKLGFELRSSNTSVLAEFDRDIGLIFFELGEYQDAWQMLKPWLNELNGSFSERSIADYTALLHAIRLADDFCDREAFNIALDKALQVTSLLPLDSHLLTGQLTFEFILNARHSSIDCNTHRQLHLKFFDMLSPLANCQQSNDMLVYILRSLELLYREQGDTHHALEYNKKAQQLLPSLDENMVFKAEIARDRFLSIQLNANRHLRIDYLELVESDLSGGQYNIFILSEATLELGRARLVVEAQKYESIKEHFDAAWWAILNDLDEKLSYIVLPFKKDFQNVTGGYPEQMAPLVKLILQRSNYEQENRLFLEDVIDYHSFYVQYGKPSLNVRLAKIQSHLQLAKTVIRSLGDRQGRKEFQLDYQMFKCFLRYGEQDSAQEWLAYQKQYLIQDFLPAQQQWRSFHIHCAEAADYMCSKDFSLAEHSVNQADSLLRQSPGLFDIQNYFEMCTLRSQVLLASGKSQALEEHLNEVVATAKNRGLKGLQMYHSFLKDTWTNLKTSFPFMQCDLLNVELKKIMDNR